MPKHRKRRIMLSIVSIVLFVVLSAQLSTVSFSVTAAGEHGELVAEEYERYRERFDRIEKIGDLENQGFRLPQLHSRYPVSTAILRLSRKLSQLT